MNEVDINNVDAVAMAVEVLCDGGVVMHPTETCYGLAVDVANEDAMKKLYELKGMERAKPVSILVDSFEMAEKYGEFNAKAKELVEKYWPGALTIIVPRKKGDDFVGVRWADHKFCEEMVRKFGGAVTTTSANRTGEMHLYNPGVEAFERIKDGVDLLVNAGGIEEKMPSTLVKVVGDKVEVLREGEVFI